VRDEGRGEGRVKGGGNELNKFPTNNSYVYHFKNLQVLINLVVSKYDSSL